MDSAPVTRGPGIGAVLLDRYELTELLARGGMSEVFEAEDRRLGRRVAVKLFRAPAADRSRFDAEVLMLAGLNHPGLVPVYDAGEEQGEAFVVLELITGPSLREVLARRGALPAEQVATLGAEIADALAYVHDRGVVHRDVTPANVLLGSDGRSHLTDFGIATLVDRARITSAATALGTAAYMSPEQVQGQDVTPATDVYALGLVLLELLTGEPAFPGPGPESALARLTRPPDTTTDVPAAWQPLLSAMTQRSADDRPSAPEVRDRLARLDLSDGATVGPVVAVPAPGPDPAAPGTFDPTVATDTVTTSLPAPGGTTVMPAAMRPDDEVPPPVTDWWRRHRIVAAILVALVLAGLASAATRSGGVAVPPPTSAVTTTEVREPEVTVAPAEEADDDGDDEEDDEGRNGGNRGKGKKGEKNDD